MSDAELEAIIWKTTEQLGDKPTDEEIAAAEARLAEDP